MANIKKNFTIRDLENISGVKSHTIRIWEKRYNLLEPKRSDTNIRYYSHQNLRKLLNVVLLNTNNHKISKISKMSEEEIFKYSREISRNNGINDEAIIAFKLSMLKFDKVLFNDTYYKLLLKKTFREVFMEVFVPFLNDIGFLWQTGTILPMHEHFISNLIVQKIQIKTEELQYRIKQSKITYVLFLPENETHELGLLYLNYELILRGHKVIYLGQSVPIDNLKYFFKNDQKLCFLTCLTIQPYDDDLDTYFKEIESVLEKTPHQLIAIGRKTKLISEKGYNFDVSFYDSILNLLKVL